MPKSRLHPRSPELSPHCALTLGVQHVSVEMYFVLGQAHGTSSDKVSGEDIGQSIMRAVSSAHSVTSPFEKFQPLCVFLYWATAISESLSCSGEHCREGEISCAQMYVGRAGGR